MGGLRIFEWRAQKAMEELAYELDLPYLMVGTFLKYILNMLPGFFVVILLLLVPNPTDNLQV